MIEALTVSIVYTYLLVSAGVIFCGIVGAILNK